MDVAEIVLRWKEFGALGVAIVLLYKLLDKAFAWLLEILGVKIKRGQSREDDLDTEVKALRADLNELKEDMAQMRAARRVDYEIANSAAIGIEKELIKHSLDLPTVSFFVDQLRTIRPLEEPASAQ